MNRKILLIFFCLFSYMTIYAQSYDQNRIVLANFIERMYQNSPFEGCRIIDDYDNSYLLSVVVLDKAKYKSELQMNRIAEVKSQRNAGEFLNGTQSFTEFTINTPKCEGRDSQRDLTETYEIIKTNSTGYIRAMQLFTSFMASGGKKVFVFAKKITK